MIKIHELPRAVCELFSEHILPDTRSIYAVYSQNLSIDTSISANNYSTIFPVSYSGKGLNRKESQRI